MSPERTTPETVYLARREFVKRAGFLVAGTVAFAACSPEVSGPIERGPSPDAEAVRAPSPQSSAPATSVSEIADYASSTDEFGDALTPLSKARRFGNYYEFTRAKTGISELSKDLVTSPWQVAVGGLVRNPRTYDLDDLRRLGQDERIYRLRCTEAWSMVLPWTGFPLNRLLREVEPLSEAKFVRFETLYDPKQMRGQDPARFAEWFKSAPQLEDCNTCNVMGETLDPNTSPYEWPYVEGLRLDEAMHELTMLATGLYGRALPPENGAPVRLIVPWKYAFKSLKAIVKIDLVNEMPVSFWMAAIPEDHGFYSNVNPDVPHSRWKQGREYRFLGQDPEPIVPTLMFNGYADQVAHLYAGMDLVVNR